MCTQVVSLYHLESHFENGNEVPAISSVAKGMKSCSLQ